MIFPIMYYFLKLRLINNSEKYDLYGPDDFFSDRQSEKFSLCNVIQQKNVCSKEIFLKWV